MADFLLLGAGFSRNWGGWLASEAFEYLLGCPEIIHDGNLRTLLWRHQEHGGFEDALAELQELALRDAPGHQDTLDRFQAAIGSMFEAMNLAFFQLPRFEFQEFKEGQVGLFLSRFDAIFTLNQDVLLEHCYASENMRFIASRSWNGAYFPGMKRIPPSELINSHSWARATWIPQPEDEYKLYDNSQPIFKLHGSSNWRNEDGGKLMIMGGAKAIAIGRTPILRRYADEVERCLLQPGARLMVIGYGFRDQHINDVIKKGVQQGLELFIISPSGAEALRSLNPTRAPNKITVPNDLEEAIQRSLIGASRRNLSEIFGRDAIELNKVMRFFER